MSCKLKLKCPVFCRECDPFDEAHGNWVWCYARQNNENCVMFERQNYPYDWEDHMKSKCICCYACRYTTVNAMPVPERKRHTVSHRRRKKLFGNKRKKIPYTEKCSKCKRYVSFDYVDVKDAFFTLEDVHECAEYHRWLRMGC
jgi:ribosomal protein L32